MLILLKYFLKIPTPDISYLTRIQTLELNCMQIDRQNRLNRILTHLPSLFPYLSHLTIDVNPKLYIDLKIVKNILDVFIELISLKIRFGHFCNTSKNGNFPSETCRVNM